MHFDVFGSALAILMMAALMFWVWMLVDCLKNPRLQGQEKLVWVLAMLAFNVFGSVAYFIVARPVPSNEA